MHEVVGTNFKPLGQKVKMLQEMKDLPAHVIGIHATGEVTKNDIDTVLIPALDRQVDNIGKINYLLYLDTDVKNWDLGAWAADAKAGLKHFTKWTKIAVVTDQTGVQKFTDMFSVVVPGEAKGFAVAEMEAAKAWVSAKEEA